MSVYLHLFHGRKDPKQDMENWGEDGPVLGPFKWVHTTYGTMIHLGDKNGDTLEDLDIVKGLVFYKGMFYGDWSIFDESVYEEERKHSRLNLAEGIKVTPWAYGHYKPDTDYFHNYGDCGGSLVIGCGFRGERRKK